jgi:hypothetical protein
MQSAAAIENRKSSIDIIATGDLPKPLDAKI